MNADCDSISVGLFGVFETQGCGRPVEDPGGVGVEGLTSSCEMTYSGSYGTRPVALKPAWMFNDVIVALYAL